MHNKIFSVLLLSFLFMFVFMKYNIIDKFMNELSIQCSDIKFSILSIKPNSDIFFSDVYPGYWYNSIRYLPSTPFDRIDTENTTNPDIKYPIHIYFVTFSLSTKLFFGIIRRVYIGDSAINIFMNPPSMGFLRPYSRIGFRFSIWNSCDR